MTTDERLKKIINILMGVMGALGQWMGTRGLRLKTY